MNIARIKGWGNSVRCPWHEDQTRDRSSDGTCLVAFSTTTAGTSPEARILGRYISDTTAWLMPTHVLP
jgi:hypothetical protein